jgi:hypothetical protein
MRSAPSPGAQPDSFALREFPGLVLPDAPADHSTISRTRRLIDLPTLEVVFTRMLQRLADAGLVKGKTVGIDATTLEANAARAADTSCGCGASAWNGPSRISTRRVGCAACTSAGTPTFASGC